MLNRLGLGLAAAAALAWSGAAAGSDVDLSGRWSATARVKAADIPFRLDLRESKGTVRATFFDGARPTNPSSPAKLDGDHLRLMFPSYAAELDLTVGPTTLDGSYVRNHASTPIHAVRGTVGTASVQRAPAIAGEWIIPKASEKGEKAWRLIVRQSGGRAEAAILRVDGDTGALTGAYADGVFRLSHFAGERPALLEIRPQPDGSLKLELSDSDGHTDLIGLRPRQALAQGYAPADPAHFTGVQDASAPFEFAFPDLEGRRWPTPIPDSAARWWWWMSWAAGARTATTRRPSSRRSTPSIGVRGWRWWPWTLSSRISSLIRSD